MVLRTHPIRFIVPWPPCDDETNVGQTGKPPVTRICQMICAAARPPVISKIEFLAAFDAGARRLGFEIHRKTAQDSLLSMYRPTTSGTLIRSGRGENIFGQ
jgi:hypothetical protein